MKHLLFAFIAFSLITSTALAKPTVSAADAAAIAQNDLASRQLDGRVYVTEMVLKTKTLSGQPEHWEVYWSERWDAKTKGKKEFGLKIMMDGSYQRLVR